MGKVVLADGREELFNIPKGYHIFKIINQNQHQQMILGVAFFDGRRQQVIFGIVIDHGFGQDLILAQPFGSVQVAVHEGSDLIHI